MPRRILVPIEGGTLAHNAVELVRVVAGPLSAEVRLVRVLPAAEWAVPVHEAEASMQLHTFAADLVEARVPTSTSLRFGRAAEEILDEARLYEADIILVATHAQQKLSGAYLGGWQMTLWA
jgi:nucleotide-binding universal stress UspA family protein